VKMGGRGLKYRTFFRLAHESILSFAHYSFNFSSS
jgi:hypothetical protein